MALVVAKSYNFLQPLSKEVSYLLTVLFFLFVFGDSIAHYFPGQAYFHIFTTGSFGSGHVRINRYADNKSESCALISI